MNLANLVYKFYFLGLPVRNWLSSPFIKRLAGKPSTRAATVKVALPALISFSTVGKTLLGESPLETGTPPLHVALRFPSPTRESVSKPGASL